MTYRGINVLTFKDIDRIHGLSNGTAKNQFKGHKEWFVSGEDYIPIPRYTYLQEVNSNGSRVGNLNSNILLITESGYDKLKPYLGNFQEPYAQPQDLQVFKYLNNEVRVIMRDGEPWFVGKDVCRVLEYSNSRDALAKHVDDEDKGVAKLDTLGGSQKLTIINESGLYALIFGSKLESAKQFKRWVTHEVLPSIRKTGGFSVMSVDKPIEISVIEENEENILSDNLRIKIGEVIASCPKYNLVALLNVYEKFLSQNVIDYYNSFKIPNIPSRQTTIEAKVPPDYANAIKSALAEKQITQVELAKRIGVSESSISYYVNNKHIPSEATFLKIMNALEVKRR